MRMLRENWPATVSGVLLAVFVAMKLEGIVSWSWWIVLAIWGLSLIGIDSIKQDASDENNN